MVGVPQGPIKTNAPKPDDKTAAPEGLSAEQLKAWQAGNQILNNSVGSFFNTIIGETSKISAAVDPLVEPVQETIIAKVTPLVPAPVVKLGIDWAKANAPDSVKQVMEDPGLALLRETAPLLRQFTQDDEKAIKFATSLGATKEELKALDPAINESIAHLGQDNSAVNTALAGIVATKEPAALLKAFTDVDPSMKLVVDEIAKDPAMTKALHAAVSKDITVLEGLQKLGGAESSLDPETMVNAMQDPANRQLFTKLLEKVAEDPNLKFDDFAEVVDAGVDMSQDPQNKAKQERYMKSLLNGFGLKDRRAELLNKYGSPIQALAQMWEDPNKFFDELAETLGGSPEQIEALKGMGKIFANFIGMYSNDPHIAAFMETYGPRMSSFGHALMSGKGPMTDTIIEIDPTKSFNTATTAPAVEPAKPIVTTSVPITPTQAPALGA